MSTIINVTSWDPVLLVQGAWAVSRPINDHSVAARKPEKQMTEAQAKELLERFKDDVQYAVNIDFIMGREMHLKVKRVRNSKTLELVNNFEPKELSDLLEFTGHKPDAPTPSTIARNFVQSTTLNSIGFDKTTNTLAIQFSNGTVYEYTDFPGSEWTAFTTADSQGSYFGKNIKGKYPTVRKADDPKLAE